MNEGNNRAADLSGLNMPTHDSVYWFVMRDLKRPNAKLPAYKRLAEIGFEVFTPMRWHIATRGGKRTREQVPFLPDLLFVHTERDLLDPIVEETDTLQYRYIRGGYRKPMIIADKEMERFIRAVSSVEAPRYYLPGEITPAMYGHKIRIIGGPLDGCEGQLLKIRGSRVKRLIIEIPGLIVASVEIAPEYIQML